MKTDKSFAEALKIWRKEAGKTQSDLADEMGVSRGAVALWESGKTAPEISKSLKLSRALNVPEEVIKEHLVINFRGTLGLREDAGEHMRSNSIIKADPVLSMINRKKRFLRKEFQDPAFDEWLNRAVMTIIERVSQENRTIAGVKNQVDFDVYKWEVKSFQEMQNLSRHDKLIGELWHSLNDSQESMPFRRMPFFDMALIKKNDETIVSFALIEFKDAPQRRSDFAISRLEQRYYQQGFTDNYIDNYIYVSQEVTPAQEFMSEFDDFDLDPSEAYVLYEVNETKSNPDHTNEALNLVVDSYISAAARNVAIRNIHMSLKNSISTRHLPPRYAALLDEISDLMRAGRINDANIQALEHVVKLYN